MCPASSKADEGGEFSPSLLMEPASWTAWLLLFGLPLVADLSVAERVVAAAVPNSP